MAEIRSTMDLVMERAARMGKATGAEIEEDTARKLGMQLAGTYLNEEESSLTAVLAEQNPALQVAIRQGVLTALLRNIFLPRDDMAEQRANRAIKGLLDLGEKTGADLVSICQEIGHIIGQYGQHRQQLREQLETQMRMQYEQVFAQQTGMPPNGLKIDPTSQPEFKEEWSRVETELDSQYNQALEQHKNLLRQRLGV